MKFAFTSFDKAILAAILAPIISLATSYLNGGNVDGKDLAAALVAAAGAGLLIYFKSNGPAAPATPAPAAPAPPAA